MEREEGLLIENVFYNIIVSYIAMLDVNGRQEEISDTIHQLIIILEGVIQPQYLPSLDNAIDHVLEDNGKLLEEAEAVEIKMSEKEFDNMTEINFENFLNEMITKIEETKQAPKMNTDDIFKSIGWER